MAERSRRRRRAPRNPLLLDLRPSGRARLAAGSPRAARRAPVAGRCHQKIPTGGTIAAERHGVGDAGQGRRTVDAAAQTARASACAPDLAGQQGVMGARCGRLATAQQAVGMVRRRGVEVGLGWVPRTTRCADARRDAPAAAQRMRGAGWLAEGERGEP